MLITVEYSNFSEMFEDIHAKEQEGWIYLYWMPGKNKKILAFFEREGK